MDKQYQPTLTEVQDWVLKLYNTCEQTITEAERREQHKYAVMVQRPQDKKFLVKMLDESSQIRDRRILAKRIKTLLDQYGVPEFLNKRDSFLFRMYQAFGHHFDFIAIPIIKKRLRMDTSQVIINEARPQLTKHLATRAKEKIRTERQPAGRSGARQRRSRPSLPPLSGSARITRHQLHISENIGNLCADTRLEL